MAISAAPLELQAKTPSASLSKVKGEARRSSTRLKTSWFSRRAYIKLVCSSIFIKAEYAHRERRVHGTTDQSYYI